MDKIALRASSRSMTVRDKYCTNWREVFEQGVCKPWWQGIKKNWPSEKALAHVAKQIIARFNKAGLREVHWSKARLVGNLVWYLCINITQLSVNIFFEKFSCKLEWQKICHFQIWKYENESIGSPSLNMRKTRHIFQAEGTMPVYYIKFIIDTNGLAKCTWPILSSFGLMLQVLWPYDQ